MKICSVVFNYPGYLDYKRLARVLEYTAGKNCPAARFELVQLPAPKVTSSHRCFTSNTVKLGEWLRVMDETDDDLIFMDADTAILRDLSPAFASAFDIGYTVHAKVTGRLPFNSGVVFVKNTPAAKAVIKAWRDINNKMYTDTKFHTPYRSKYAGMNQASFGYVLEHKELQDGAVLKAFPCREWNSCKEDWGALDQTTRVLHVKSDLRRMIMQGIQTELCGRNVKAVRIWRELERQAREPHVTSRISAVAQSSRDEQYQAHLKEAQSAFDAPIVARRDAVKFLSKILCRKMRPSFGLCHGSGKGFEQQWFSQYLGGCEVVGTEISPEAAKLPKTVVWDFGKPNPEWRHCADFIYSNSFSLAFDKRSTFLAWVEALKPRGVMVIEGASAELVQCVPEWTGGAWEVVRSFGLGDAAVSYAMIEHSKARASEEQE